MFNLLSKLNIPAKNVMFCTIEPNKAKVEVPDKRLDHLCEVYKPKSKVPASLTILDIAGLVKGASEGQGMGNEFLSNIQAVDGIYHVVRAFDDEDIQHFEGDVDPVRDMEIIQGELMTKDTQVLDKNLADLNKQIERNGTLKDLIFERDTLNKVKALYSEGKNVRDNPDWNYKEIDILNKYLFFTAKPMVYVINLSEEDYIRKKNKFLGKIQKWIVAHGGGKIIPFSCTLEEKLMQMTPEEKEKFCKENNTSSAIDKLVQAGYYELGLIHFLTAGPDECRNWTVRNGSKAPQAAGVIHTDMERGFICAEVMKYDDFQRLGNEKEVQKAGLVRTEGKNYVVCDGDICYFKFNVSDPGKKKKEK